MGWFGCFQKRGRMESSSGIFNRVGFFVIAFFVSMQREGNRIEECKRLLQRVLKMRDKYF